MNTPAPQPNWDAIAEKFDIWLPQLEPVGEALIAALDVQKGDHLLDVASGTGEPALTLAKHMRDSISICGVDAAHGMISVAKQKAEKAGLSNISFQEMAAESLDFPENSFDRALCRFGVMLFDNPLQGLQSIHRALKPGGTFVASVWGMPEKMTTLYWSYMAFKDRVPEDTYPPLEKVTSLGEPGVAEALFSDAGFTNVRVERKMFDYHFPSFDAYWEAMIKSDLLKIQFAALLSDEHPHIENDVRRQAAAYISDQPFTVPHEYILISATKAA